MYKPLLLIALNLLIVGSSFGQTELDSLTASRQDLMKEKDELNDKIETVERQIISNILANGYEVTLEKGYSGKIYEVHSDHGTGEVIATLSGGDKILVIGRERVYYKVKIGEKVGFIYLSNAQYPINLLDEYKYRDLVKGKEKTKSSNSGSHSSGSGCSSVQCSGRTKSGSRCKRHTTSCSGRCYQH